MEFEDYDFTRNPVVQNQVFFLESKCSCGFSILARSIEELVEQEAFPSPTLQAGRTVT